MAEFKELLLKMARNETLTAQELDDLSRFGTETQRRNAFVAGNTTAENLLNVVASIETVYDIIFEADTAEITIQIPDNVYNHLIVLFAGRTTRTGAYFDNVFGQFNGDAGTNYIGNQIQLLGAVLSGVVGSALGYFGVSVSPSADTTAGSSGGTFMFIPNIRSSLWKYSLSLQSSKQTAVGVDTSMLSMLQSFWWKDTSPINSIRFFAENSAIATGSQLTILGIR